MRRSNGGIIGPDNVTTGGPFGSGSGVFKLSEATNLIKEGKWPTPGPEGYQVANSCRFNNGFNGGLDDAYLNRTPSSASNRRTFTLSAWIKRGSHFNDEHPIFSAGEGSGFSIRFSSEGGSNSAINVYEYVSGWQLRVHTNAEYRDPAAWMHLVVAFDTTQGTASNRIKIYVNGNQVTSLGNSDYPSENYDTLVNSSILHTIARNGTAGDYYDGYMSEVVFIDGLQLDPTSFGEFNSNSGIWIPKTITGLTYGTNGFYLPFQNSAALGQDDSGEGNNFTVNNLTSIDQTTDTPSNNFATMNPLAVPPANAATFAEGNLKISTNTTAAQPILSTIGVSQGKWYVECKRISYDGGTGADDGFRIGFGVTYVQDVNLIPPAISNSGHYFMIGNGTVYNGSTDLGDKAGDSNVSDDGVVGIALDLDNNRISWSFNGAWMTGSDAWGGSSPSSYVDIASGYTYFFLQTDGSTGRAYTAGWNFGGTSAFAISSGNTDANGFGNFETAPPSGYLSLCTNNLNAV